MQNLTHLSLFTGVGGMDVAAEQAGFRTVGQCEWADYPFKVLEKHWPDVPRWHNITTLTKESFHEKTGLRSVTVLSGGFPCQPFSHAGKRRGRADDRYLWPEMLRVIRDTRPTWVLGENVAGIVSMALDQVLADLEDADYTAGAVVFPAAAVDAPHRRDRTAILAHSNGIGHIYRPLKIKLPEAWQHAWRNTGAGRTDVADADRFRLQAERGEPEPLPPPAAEQPAGGGCEEGIHHTWEPEPGICRVVDGLPHRVDRLKCLGNAVVPQQFYPIFDAIAKIEALRDI